MSAISVKLSRTTPMVEPTKVWAPICTSNTKVLPRALAFCCLNNPNAASCKRLNICMRKVSKPVCVALVMAT